MNITVLTKDGKVVVRPDTTRVKDEENVWMPDFSKSSLWTVVIYTRLIKSGKCIEAKFSSRYFEETAAGILFYPSELMGSDPSDFAQALCLDHSSALRLKLFPTGNKELKAFIDGEEVYSQNVDTTAILGRALECCSINTLQRLGDIVAVELTSPMELRPVSGHCHFEGYLGADKTFDFEFNS